MMDTSAGNFDQPGLLDRHGHLLIVIPPLLVLLLASLLFESSIADAPDFTRTVRSLVTEPVKGAAPPVLREAQARYIWFSSVILNLFTPVYVSICCSLIISQCCSKRRLRGVVLVGIALCAAGIAFLLYSSVTENTLKRVVFDFTFQALEAS
ncbi:MAG TPA: hypothetical protein VNA16_10345, partial [Abditibacteriaceae bacterium]|nr:hypothetical protein [Abditibacteriaceae bacterium]